MYVYVMDRERIARGSVCKAIIDRISPSSISIQAPSSKRSLIWAGARAWNSIVRGILIAPTPKDTWLVGRCVIVWCLTLHSSLNESNQSESAELGKPDNNFSQANSPLSCPCICYYLSIVEFNVTSWEKQK